MDSKENLEQVVEQVVGATPTTPAVSSVPADTAGQKNDVVFQDKPKKSVGMIFGMILCAVLAIGGIGFGVWAMMDGNAKEVRLNEEIGRLKQQLATLENEGKEQNEGGETGNWYGKPSSVDNLESVSITYNSGNDYINVSEERVDYYTYDDEGNLIEESLHEMEMDTSEIRKYVFDNDLDYLTEYTTNDEHDWSVAVYGPGTTCMAFGDGEHPKWLDDLLARLNVSDYGNYSKK